MATTTKAAKSLTINGTSFQLANKLAINSQNKKLQLLAKNVVFDEVELPKPTPGTVTYDNTTMDVNVTLGGN